MIASLFRDFVAGSWRSECYAYMKPSTRRSVDSYLTHQLLPVFGGMRIDQIRRNHVNRWFDRYSATAPVGANRALDVMRQILNHAKVHGHIETNPATRASACQRTLKC